MYYLSLCESISLISIDSALPAREIARLILLRRNVLAFMRAEPTRGTSLGKFIMKSAVANACVCVCVR